MWRPRWVVVIVGLQVVAVLSAAFFLSHSAPISRVEIHVRQNQLVNARGQSVRLFGVNRSGTEYACVNGSTGIGIFSGPRDAGSIAVMALWHINAIRVPLNEDCWLGINGVNPAYSGRRYRDAIASYVRSISDAGLVSILDLHWNAPGPHLSDGQRVMADKDHAPAFWTSVATRFRDNPGVMFDLYNEPRGISWSCWRSGCKTQEGWQTAGMQSLISAVRRTGANQPIIVAGLNNANDLSGWLSHPLRDPADQLVAGVHMYNTGPPGYCNTPACWSLTLAAVAKQVPVFTAELGETDRRSDFVTTYLGWADDQWRLRLNVSALGWSWDAALGEGGPSLVAAFDGTPTPYGLGFRSDLAGLFKRGEIRQG
jgi:hypothetical protein